ncbi:MAG: hypothetical protein JSW50_10990 [Candidatus Latescibacterota bacterium]|nr:MAG: hypothetical protein JSW50_10990 [Candidatus Latescibacterota bacterium]
MNLAVLVSDYTSYQFEKGALNYYELCNGCDDNGLPFTVTYNPPGDFGDITFEYDHTGDTLFFGTIIWMGRGGIVVPKVFFEKEQFERVGKPSRDPLSVDYFNIVPQLDEDRFKEKADSAWAEVRTIDLVAEFAKNPYRIGIYLYAPAQGVFDPSVAKWIVFVYRGRV